MVSLQHSWSDITATCTHFSRGLDLSLRLDRLPLDMCDCAQVSRNGLWCLRVERANTIDKLRDLELGNEVRVLARSLPCTASFVTGRDIIHNTTMLCRNLWAAHEEAVQGDDPYLLLALGCSKGYNRMDHSWLQRCLRTASTPPEIPGPRWMPFGEPAGAHLGRCRICASSSGFRFAHKVAQHHACFSSLELIPSCLLCNKLIMFQVFLVSSMIGPWAAKACLLSLKFPIWYSSLRSNGHLVSQFGTVISASPFVNVCLVYTSVFMHPFMTCITTQSTSLIVALSVFGCVRTSLSLTMRVLVANIFMCTLFAYPNRHFFHAPVFCCKRLSAKLCGFWHQSHGPNWECSRQSAHCMALNYPFKIWGCPTSLVCCLLTKAGLTFVAVLSLRYVGGGDSTLIFPTLPSVGKLRLFFSGILWDLRIQTFLKEAGQSRPVRPFRFLYQRLAGAELHRWETYLERRVRAKGWDGPILRRTLRQLPRSVPQAHRRFLLKAHLNAPIAPARLAAARVVDEPLQCCFCLVWIICRVATQCSTSMIVFVLLRIYFQYLMDSVTCYKNDGKAVWWLALLLSLLPSGMSMCRRGVRFFSFVELRDLVLVSLQCPWLVRCCPTRSNKQRRQDRILPPLPTPGVTIYRSDGACRGQGTGAVFSRAGVPLCGRLMIVVLVLA